MYTLVIREGKMEILLNALKYLVQMLEVIGFEGGLCRLRAQFEF